MRRFRGVALKGGCPESLCQLAREDLRLGEASFSVA